MDFWPTSDNLRDSVASIGLYQYSQLESTQIRCIELEEHGDLHFGMLRIHERTKGGYTALSYAWGSPTPDTFRKVFIVNDGTVEGYVPVTENLDNALLDLRKSSLEPKIFFIDQITINQHDNDEKAVQVANMGDVYKCADRVVTYLGPVQEGDDQAMALLVRIAKHFEV